MRLHATLYLVAGLMIIFLALGIAVTSLSNQPLTQETAQQTSCVHCQMPLHWQSALPMQPTTDADQFCSRCHFLAETNASTNVQSQIHEMQDRIVTLREALEIIYQHHPEWDIATPFAEKSATQLTVERASTMLNFLEIDSSWGFHNPVYAQEVLEETERLVAELQED